MICVIAKIELAEGRRDDYLARFHELVPKVREEEGCLEYGPMVDVPGLGGGQSHFPCGKIGTAPALFEQDPRLPPRQLPVAESM